MPVNLTRSLRWIGLLMTLAAGAIPSARASDSPAAEVLKDRSLKQSQHATWVLPAENQVLGSARNLRDVSRRLAFAQSQQQQFELGGQNPQVMIASIREQMSWLDQQIMAYDQEMANLGPTGNVQSANVYRNMLVQQRNAIVAEHQRLGTLINNISNQKEQFQEMMQQFQGEVARLRETYRDAVDELRKSVDELQNKYAELGDDAAVKKALADLSSSTRTKHRLGPSKPLADAIQWLKKLEGSVRTETIELHRENGVDHIDVTLNGKGPVRMLFDTGAGPTMLPATLAERLNLRPTGRTLPCQTADGTKVMSKEMVIRSVSVGALSVKDVTCVVMPKEKGDVTPLFGQSILERFDYKYTQGSGRLVLTKVEPDEPATPKGKGSGSTKKRKGR